MPSTEYGIQSRAHRLLARSVTRVCLAEPPVTEPKATCPTPQDKSVQPLPSDTIIPDINTITSLLNEIPDECIPVENTITIPITLEDPPVPKGPPKSDFTALRMGRGRKAKTKRGMSPLKTTNNNSTKKMKTPEPTPYLEKKIPDENTPVTTRTTTIEITSNPERLSRRDLRAGRRANTKRAISPPAALKATDNSRRKMKTRSETFSYHDPDPDCCGLLNETENNSLKTMEIRFEPSPDYENEIPDDNILVTSTTTVRETVLANEIPDENIIFTSTTVLRIPSEDPYIPPDGPSKSDFKMMKTRSEPTLNDDRNGHDGWNLNQRDNESNTSSDENEDVEKSLRVLKAVMNLKELSTNLESNESEGDISRALETLNESTGPIQPIKKMLSRYKRNAKELRREAKLFVGKVPPTHKDFPLIFGNNVRNYLHQQSPTLNTDLDSAYVNYSTSPWVQKVIDSVWNSTFSQVFKSRDSEFCLIDSEKALSRIVRPNSNDPIHFIFANCSSSSLDVIATFLDLHVDEAVRNSVVSIGFFNCEFQVWKNILQFLSPRFTSLVALSVVHCSLQTGHFHIRKDLGRLPQLQRVEVGVGCNDQEGYWLSQLALAPQSLISISHRVHHTVGDCAKDPDHHLLSLMTAELVWSAYPCIEVAEVEELEFDMDLIEPEALKVFYERVLATQVLRTFVFTGTKRKDMSRIRKFCQEMLSLTAVEIKSGAYFPPGEGPNVLTFLGGSGSEIKDLKLSGVRPVPPQRTLKVRDALSLLLPCLKNLEIEDSEIADVEKSVGDQFRWNRQLYLTALRLPSLQDLAWDFIGDLSNVAQSLVQLDLSGFSRWAPRTLEKELTDPMDAIFRRMKKLKVLVLDNLSIDDSNLIGKLQVRNLCGLINAQDDTEVGNNIKGLECLSILCLTELQFLSLQNTNISNRTVRCVSRFMLCLERLNVSFTHVNEDAVEDALIYNQNLSIRAEGCGLPKVEYSYHSC